MSVKDVVGELTREVAARAGQSDQVHVPVRLEILRGALRVLEGRSTRNWRAVLAGERVGDRTFDEDGVCFGDLFLSKGDLAVFVQAVREEPARREAARVEESEGRRDC